MSPVITPEVALTIRNALYLMKTQEPYQIACFVYALGHANGCMEMSARNWRASRSPRRSLPRWTNEQRAAIARATAAGYSRGCRIPRRPPTMSERIPCRVSAELRAYMRKQDEQYASRDIPDFRDSDIVKEVTDGEICGPIADLVNAKEQYMTTNSPAIKEMLVTDMLVAISKLERALYAKWDER
jgi:hypothetical protein